MKDKDDSADADADKPVKSANDLELPESTEPPTAESVFDLIFEKVEDGPVPKRRSALRRTTFGISERSHS